MYDYPTAAEPEPDRRIVAMHRVVDLERQYEDASRDVAERQKMLAVVEGELGEARDVLSGLLGYPSMTAKVMSADAVGISKARY